jgi:hypothetical protein
MATEDPLRAFFRVRDVALGGAKPFEGGEHLWLGYEGARRAAERLGVRGFGPFQRKTAPEALTYGEIVAFSGDFYESPGDLFEEKPSPLPWLWEDNDLGDLIESLNHELTWIKQPMEERKTSYPDENVALWWNAKHYVELALRNNSHFGWHNALMYARWHEAALAMAARAAAETDRDRKALLFREAVYTNGFADHFLTDGFAAGHVRTPAAQIRDWVAAKEKASPKEGWTEKLAGALVKVIHDQDGHVREIHGQAAHHGDAEGLRVLNARGDDWLTRCDGQLFLTGPETPAVQQAVNAVDASVTELLTVVAGGPIAEGVFAATEWIPWAHPEETPLVEKFPQKLDDARAKALYESIRWYVKLPRVAAGVRPAHIQALCEALPALMQGFRDDVAAAVQAYPDVVRRLAPKLVQGYREIR